MDGQSGIKIEIVVARSLRTFYGNSLMHGPWQSCEITFCFDIFATILNGIPLN